MLELHRYWCIECFSQSLFLSGCLYLRLVILLVLHYLYAFTLRYHPVHFVQSVGRVARPKSKIILRPTKSTQRRLVVIAEPTCTCSHSMNEEAVKTRDRVSLYLIWKLARSYLLTQVKVIPNLARANMLQIHT